MERIPQDIGIPGLEEAPASTTVPWVPLDRKSCLRAMPSPARDGRNASSPSLTEFVHTGLDWDSPPNGPGPFVLAATSDKRKIARNVADVANNFPRLR